MESSSQIFYGVPEDARASDPVDRLLEDSWETRSRQATRRELISETLAAGLFLSIAVAFAVPGLTSPGFDPGLALLLVALYAVVSRAVKFPVGAGYVVPSYLVLAPMLLLLPPSTVPLLACAGLVLGTIGRVLAGRATLQDLLFAVPDAAHALGPALVLWLAGPIHGVEAAYAYFVAFLAGCLADLVSSSLRESSALGVAPRLQVKVVAQVWLVDACIAPVGLALAHAGRGDHALLLSVLPLSAVMMLIDRDRKARIVQAQARLEMVGRERSRLQTAVARLGEAFAAKLDLPALTSIALRGAIDALDADAGQLTLILPPRPTVTQSEGATCHATLLEAAASLSRSTHHPQQVERDGVFAIAVPLATGDTEATAGALVVARADRGFRPDEEALMVGLVERVDTAVRDILANEAVREQAVTDPLTGLGNRRKLMSELADRLADRSPAGGEPLVLMMFDLDGFKSYNDAFGHLAGDALLSRLGTKLATAIAGAGTAYRLGGDEFCALLPARRARTVELVAGAADALCEQGETFSVRSSCGAVLLPYEASTPDYALQLADERMYAQKRGRPSAVNEQTRDLLVGIMRAKQPGLPEHSTGVARLAAAVGRRLGMNAEELDELARAAELHDIGKVGIPDAILDKPGALDEAEWEFIRQHTILGERILSAMPALRPVATIVRASHERWDGRGYPDRLGGEDIPLPARIVAVCDAYEAITSDRSYRKCRTAIAARKELLREAGRQFDPIVVAAFLSELEQPQPEPCRSPTTEAQTSWELAEEVAQRVNEMLECENGHDNGMRSSGAHKELQPSSTPAGGGSSMWATA